MRILVATTGYMGARLIDALAGSDHEVVGLLQSARKNKSWFSRSMQPGLLKHFGGNQSAGGTARRHGIPIFFIDKMTPDELAPIEALKPDLLLVGGFDIILKAPLLRLPRIGCINTHSSLLPKHRGPNPFRAAIAMNEAETGVTFHVMDEGIDTGDILAQHAFPIGPRDDSGVLYRKASELGAETVLDLLEQVESKGLKGTPQDPALATYDKNPPPEAKFLDWTQPAEDLDRVIRSYLPFALPRFRYRERVVFLSRAHFDEEDPRAEPGTILTAERPIVIATGRGRLKLNVAFTTRPVPFYWPAPWFPAVPGTRAE